MIVPHGSMARLRERFHAQFTPAARGWIYRRGGRGPALPVGEEDVAELIAAFDRRSRWLSWGGIAAAAAMIGVATWQEWPPFVGMAVFVLLWSAAMWWAWTAPARLLDGRAPVARALTTGERRRLGLRELPWRMLVFGALLAVGLAVRVGFEPDPWSPANRGYLGWAAVLLLLFAGLAVAKRRAG